MPAIVSLSNFNFSFTPGKKLKDIFFLYVAPTHYNRPIPFLFHWKCSSLTWFFCIGNWIKKFRCVLRRSRNASIAAYGFDICEVWEASSLIYLDRILHFSRAIVTVFQIKRFNRSLSFKYIILNFYKILFWYYNKKILIGHYKKVKR